MAGQRVLGGLAISSVFTLVLVPTLFSLLMDLRPSLRDGSRASRPDPTVQAEPSATLDVSN